MDNLKKTKIRVTKEDFLNALDDISTIFDFEDMIDVETATVREMIDYIEKKQKTDDCFNESDFEVKKGKAVGLLPSTVKALIAAKVTVPEPWAKRLKSLNLKEEEEEEIDPNLDEVEVDEDDESQKIAEEDSAGEFDDVDKETKEKKAVIKKADEKVTKKVVAVIKGSRAIRAKVYEELFTKGATKEEVIEAVKKAAPDSSLSTIKTEICDSKNPKYNKLSKLVVEKDGKLSFK